MENSPIHVFLGTLYGPHHSCSKSKFMWAYWQLSSPTNLENYDIYCKAVSHGCHVIHRVPVTDAANILPHWQIQGSPPVYLPRSRTSSREEYPFKESESKDIEFFNSKYIQEVQRLLYRENARAFLEHGGLIWRIALEFGGPRLWSDLFLGPSIFCVDARLGERVPDYGWIADSPSQEELDLLLGVVHKPDSQTYAVSLFPPYHVFHGSPHWTGVWMNDNEEWFQKLVQKLRAGQLKPHAKAHWRTSTGRSNKGTLTEEVAHSFVNKFRLNH
jgi:hypothetical protein